MSDTAKDTGTQEKTQEQSFRIEDFKKGTFILYDKVYQTERRWKLGDETPVGISYLIQEIEQQGDKLRGVLPEGVNKLSAEERRKHIQEYFEKLPEEERVAKAQELARLSKKQLGVMSTFCEPLFEIPDMWENKMECLASCLSHDKDPAKINAFFLIKSIGSTNLPEDLNTALGQVMKEM